jgi:hypothetical protein
VEFRGVFGSGSLAGAIVYLCFPVETIGDVSVRQAVISRVLDLFETAAGVESNWVLPDRTVLLTNYPNPFNPRTRISFTLPEAGGADLRLFDPLGREVAVLHAGRAPAGETALDFDGTRFASGVYYLRLSRDAGPVLVRRLVIVK